jgi:hypothetical protein
MPAGFQPSIIAMVLQNLFKRENNKRKFVRHPAEIPIEYELEGDVSDSTQMTRNISFGGLCFQSPVQLEKDMIIQLRFTSLNPDFRIRGRIAWSASKGDSYDVGVEFMDQGDARLAKIIEEIIQIKNFQKQVFENDR